MRGRAEMTIPEVALVLGTRAALGVGLGLLLANRFSEEQRRSVGGTLLVAGAFGAAVLVSELFGRPRRFAMTFGQEPDDGASPREPDTRLARETAMAGD